MKVRVKKLPNGFYEPQYLDENGKFGPHWNVCHLTNNLTTKHYETMEAAIEVCEKYFLKRKQEDGEIVWEREF